MTEHTLHQIPLREESILKLVIVVIFSVVFPLYFIPIIDELDFARPELFKDLIIIASVGTVVPILYSLWHMHKLKKEKKNIAVEITNLNLKIFHPEESAILLNDIAKAYWKDDENNKHKVFLELKDSNQENILVINTKNINLSPIELCTLINQSL